jgi:hypothetical protein
MLNRLFVPAYKACYMTLIVANFFMLYNYGGFRERTTWTIGIVVLVLNLLSWILFSQRLRVGQISEQMLSLGRIAVLLLAAFIFFADLIGLYSPIGVVLWLNLLRLTSALSASRFLVWWLVCAILLALEFAYFRGVSAPFQEADTRKSLNSND